MSFFSFAEMKWYPKQIFPFLDLLYRTTIDFTMSADSRQLLLMSMPAPSQDNQIRLFVFDLIEEVWDIFTEFLLDEIELFATGEVKIHNGYVYVFGAGGSLPTP